MSETNTPAAATPEKDTRTFALVGQESRAFDGKIYVGIVGAKRAQGRLNGRECSEGCHCDAPELLDLVPVTLTFGETARKGARPAKQEDLPGADAAPAANPDQAPVEG